MKKKLLLFNCILMALLTLSGCANANKSTTYIMADVQEGDHPTAVACDKFAEMVKSRTNGRIHIEVYHGDVLGSEKEQLTQVTVGGIDFARVSGPLSSYNEDFKAFQSLYLYESEDDMWSVLKGSVGDEFLNAKGFTDKNIVGLCWFSGGSRNFYNNKKVVKTPADLKDLKLRVNTDPMIKLLENNGATGINIAYNDIYNSIKEGVIDGAENNWPSYISTEHYKVAPYITIDQHTSIPEIIAVSKTALDSMSAKDQEIVKECAKEISDYQIKAMAEYSEKAVKEAEAAGCTVTYLTEEESKKFREQGAQINAEVNAQYADIIKRLTGK